MNSPETMLAGREIGDKIPISEIRKGDMILKLLSPTDCVKDRLAAYHWNDRPSLEQAVLVYQNQSVDLDEVERWSESEGMEDEFKLFCKTGKKRLPS